MGTKMIDEISNEIALADTSEKSVDLASKLMAAAFIAYTRHLPVDTAVAYMYDFADRMVISRNDVDKVLEKLRESSSGSS